MERVIAFGKNAQGVTLLVLTQAHGAAHVCTAFCIHQAQLLRLLLELSTESAGGYASDQRFLQPHRIRRPHLILHHHLHKTPARRPIHENQAQEKQI
jgi:hypothetical protein